MLTLELKKLYYTAPLLVMSQGELKTPEFLALNPRGLAPVMRDGDVVLAESVAILAYLERKAPDPPMFGKTAEETGRIWKFIVDCHNYLKPAVDRLVGPALESHIYGGVDENADDMREAAKRAWARLISTLVRFLSNIRRLEFGCCALPSLRVLQKPTHPTGEMRPDVEFLRSKHRLDDSC